LFYRHQDIHTYTFDTPSRNVMWGDNRVVKHKKHVFRSMSRYVDINIGILI
jgi:hypothetical protein